MNLKKHTKQQSQRDSYINCSDEDKKKIDEVYVECIGKFIEIPKPKIQTFRLIFLQKEVKTCFQWMTFYG